MSLVFSPVAISALATSATAQAITTATTNCEAIIIMANSSNTGYCYIGNSSMTITSAWPLGPGEKLPMSMDLSDRGTPNLISLSSIFWMADTTTNGLRVAVLGRSS